MEERKEQFECSSCGQKFNFKKDAEAAFDPLVSCPRSSLDKILCRHAGNRYPAAFEMPGYRVARTMMRYGEPVDPAERRGYELLDH